MLKFEGKTEKVNFAELEKGDWVVVDGRPARIVVLSTKGYRDGVVPACQIQYLDNFVKEMATTSNKEADQYIGFQDFLFDKIVDGVIHITQEF